MGRIAGPELDLDYLKTHAEALFLRALSGAGHRGLIFCQLLANLCSQFDTVFRPLFFLYCFVYTA